VGGTHDLFRGYVRVPVPGSLVRVPVVDTGAGTVADTVDTGDFGTVGTVWVYETVETVAVAVVVAADAHALASLQAFG
jgi:hypothetical protein